MLLQTKITMSDTYSSLVIGYLAVSSFSACLNEVYYYLQFFIDETAFLTTSGCCAAVVFKNSYH
jgi:hypothetical protein